MPLESIGAGFPCSVVVVAYHGDRWLPDCLASLKETLPQAAHLLLVDNSGNTIIDSLDLNSFKCELLRTDEPLGFSAANNFALVRAAKLQSAVCFLNQDTLSTEDWLTPCLELLATQPDIAAVTPLTRTYDNSGWDPYFLECARKSQEFSQALEEGMPFAPFYPVPVIPAAAMVVRTDVLRKVGPFDPIYGSYYEDYDLCHRIRRAGYQVGVCTGRAVRHFSGSATATPAAERQRARWITKNRVIYSARVNGRKRLSFLAKNALFDFPRGLARSVLRRPKSKPLSSYLMAYVELLVHLPRLISERRDERYWINYLESISWNRLADADSVSMLTSDCER